LVLHSALIEYMLLAALRDSGGKVVGITWFEDGLHYCSSGSNPAGC
jgi:hypothetical protein